MKQFVNLSKPDRHGARGASAPVFRPGRETAESPWGKNGCILPASILESFLLNERRFEHIREVQIL